MLRGSTAADMASKRSNTPTNISPPPKANANQDPSKHNQTDSELQDPSTPHSKDGKPREQKEPKFNTLGEKFMYFQKLAEEVRREKNTIDLAKDEEDQIQDKKGAPETKEKGKGKEKEKEQRKEKEKEGDAKEKKGPSIETQVNTSNEKRKPFNSTMRTPVEEELEEIMPLGTRQLGIEKGIRDEYTSKRLAFEREMELIEETREGSSRNAGKKILYSTPDLQKLTTTLTDTLYTTTPLTIPHLLQSLHTLRNTIPRPQHPLLSQQILLSINNKLLFGHSKATLMTSIDNHVSHVANTRPDIINSRFWDNYYARIRRPEGRFCGLGGFKEKVMVLAMGICVLVAPWVIRDLGFLGWLGWYWEVVGEGEDGKEGRELGCVDFVEDGSFAEKWIQKCNGEIDKAMLYSYFLELGMVWD